MPLTLAKRHQSGPRQRHMAASAPRCDLDKIERVQSPMILSTRRLHAKLPFDLPAVLPSIMACGICAQQTNRQLKPTSAIQHLPVRRLAGLNDGTTGGPSASAPALAPPSFAVSSAVTVRWAVAEFREWRRRLALNDRRCGLDMAGVPACNEPEWCQHWLIVTPCHSVK